MDDEPPLKRFKVSREGTGQAEVEIEHYLADEQVSKVIAGAVELPSEAGNISLHKTDGKNVLMSFKSLKSDVEYTVHHHPPKTSALPDPKCETIEVPKLKRAEIWGAFGCLQLQAVVPWSFLDVPTVFFHCHVCLNFSISFVILSFYDVLRVK